MGDLGSGLESMDWIQGVSALFDHKSASRILKTTTSLIIREVQVLKLVTSRYPLSHMALVWHLLQLNYVVLRLMVSLA